MCSNGSELPPSPGVGSTFLSYLYFTFLSSIKAILVRCAHRLLSELPRILLYVEERAPWKANARRLHPANGEESITVELALSLPCGEFGLRLSP
jgi:hypothetical protein